MDLSRCHSTLPLTNHSGYGMYRCRATHAQIRKKKHRIQLEKPLPERNVHRGAKNQYLYPPPRYDGRINKIKKNAQDAWLGKKTPIFWS